jgi:hypothetical protein
MNKSGKAKYTFEQKYELYKEIRKRLDKGIGLNQSCREVKLILPEFGSLGIEAVRKMYHKFREHAQTNTLQEYKQRLDSMQMINTLNNEISIEEIDKQLEEHKALKEHCETQGIPVDEVRHYWHKSENFSVFAKNTKEVHLLEAVDAIVEKHLSGNIEKFTPPKKQKVDNKNKAFKLVLSDMHVGLNPNPNGIGLYDYEYNSNKFYDNLQHAFCSLKKEYEQYGKVDTLFLFDLGDGLDGWNQETTRGGHKLDQNLNNVGQFQTYVEGKMMLIKSIVEADFADKICIRNVANCNHSGDFGAIANWTIMKLIEQTYKDNKIEFYILQRFMEHFVYGEHCFIQTHGKDFKYMKRGLPLKLDANTINFITNYIDKYKINSKYIHVEKGDLHQIGYEKCRAFDYRNYMSFAPPSVWAQHNFVSGYFGYSIQVIDKNNGKISHTDYFFEE